MSAENHLPPPPAQMMNIISGFWTSCCVYAAARLNLAALLSEGPMSAAQIAKATETHEPSMFRLLRALSSAGVFQETVPRNFANTPLSETLRPGVPGSMRAMAIAQLGDHYRAWGNLMFSLRTGGIAFDDIEGMDLWAYYNSHPAEGVNFMEAMTGLTQAVAHNVGVAYDFKGLGTIVDVGGGNGALLASVLKRTPEAKGIVFDEEYVVEQTRKRLAEQDLADRCTVAAGSFFDSVPSGADAYLLKMVLHDWDDEKALAILRNISGAMDARGRVLILEPVMTPGNNPHPGKWMDMNMLVMTGGKERSKEEWKALFSRSGLKLSRIVDTPSPMISVVEAIKA